MHSSFVWRTMRSRWSLAFSALACTLALAACGSDSTGPAPRPASTNYDGVGILSDGEGSSIHIVFDEAQARVVGTGHSDVVVTCTVVCGTAFGFALSGGSVSGDTVTFWLTADTYEVTGTGTLKGGRLTGTIVAIAPTDTITGTFSAYASQGGNDVRAYCGNWASSQDGSGGGWHFLVAGSEVVGFGSVGDVTAKIAGSFTNDEFKLKATATQDGVTATLNATGAYTTPGDSSQVSGTYDASALGTTDHGTWSGQLCDSIAY